MGGITCSNCGSTLAEGSAFCPNCGTGVLESTRRACSDCGATLAEGSAFCGSCGAPVLERSVRESPAAAPQGASPASSPPGLQQPSSQTFRATPPSGQPGWWKRRSGHPEGRDHLRRCRRDRSCRGGSYRRMWFRQEWKRDHRDHSRLDGHQQQQPRPRPTPTRPTATASHTRHRGRSKAEPPPTSLLEAPRSAVWECLTPRAQWPVTPTSTS